MTLSMGRWPHGQGDVSGGYVARSGYGGGGGQGGYSRGPDALLVTAGLVDQVAMVVAALTATIPVTAAGPLVDRRIK